MTNSPLQPRAPRIERSTPQEIERIRTPLRDRAGDQPVRRTRTDEVGMVLGGRWYKPRCGQRLRPRPHKAAIRSRGCRYAACGHVVEPVRHRPVSRSVSTSSAAAGVWRTGAARNFWGGVVAPRSIRRRRATSRQSPTPASCRRNRLGSNHSSLMAWSVMCWIDSRAVVWSG